MKNVLSFIISGLKGFAEFGGGTFTSEVVDDVVHFYGEGFGHICSMDNTFGGLTERQQVFQALFNYYVG